MTEQTLESMPSMEKQKLKSQKFGLQLQKSRFLQFASQSSNQVLMGITSRTFSDMQLKYQLHCKGSMAPIYLAQNTYPI